MVNYIYWKMEIQSAVKRKEKSEKTEIIDNCKKKPSRHEISCAFWNPRTRAVARNERGKNYAFPSPKNERRTAPDAGAAMTTAAAWPVCTICYEDLRPLSDQHLYCLPSCGHVFHALWSRPPSKSLFFSCPVFNPAMASWFLNLGDACSLEQWLEYCPGGKKKGTCPICKHPCGAAHPPTRLFFQSTGACPTRTCPSSQDASEGSDPDELASEVTRLEQKAASLGRVVEEQRDGIQKLNAEVSIADYLSGSVCWVAFRVGLPMHSWWFWVRLQGGGSRRQQQKRSGMRRGRRKSAFRCCSIRKQR
jgi:hypothetical protein